MSLAGCSSGGNGKITATTISLRERSFFEAEGSGLTATVNMTARFDPGHEGGGTLLIGLRDAPRSVASTLTLGNSTVNMGDQTNIEMSLFSGSSSDQINFLSTGTMSLTGTVHLNFTATNSYTPVLNDSWTLFTGNTANIVGSGTFALDLPTLGSGLSWDQSDFNQAGGWQLSVVPEPATVLMLGLGAAFLIVRCRRASRTS